MTQRVADFGEGAIASGHPLTSAAAETVLRAGGNAFDAAAAAGFASAMTEPALTTVGGGGFLLARTAEGEETVFDFFADTPGRGLAAADLEPDFTPITVHFPSADQVFNVGLGSAAVPGVLKGLLHVQRKLGRLPLAEVVAPAVRYAREGIVMSGFQAHVLSLLEPILTLTQGARRLFAPSGVYLEEGHSFRNPVFADFLEGLPQGGGESFYSGAIADRIHRDMRAGHGLLTKDDLAAYKVIEREPLRVRYQGCEVLLNPEPSFGGGLIALSLLLLDHVPRDGRSDAERLARVMHEVHELRGRGVICPARLAADGNEAAFDRVRRRFTRGTTHVSVADREGNVASMTTSNGEGSGYLAPGTGVLINNMMGEDDLHPDGFHAAPPGDRVASMMCPSLVLREGRVELVLGSGGSKRIRTAILQVLNAVIERGLSLEDAVRAPRMHLNEQCLHVEPGHEEATLAVLEDTMHLCRWGERSMFFGGVHALRAARDGSPPEAYGDPRRGGDGRLL
ncbi:MAG: gamma-glutamyltransferase [Planctomycetota bacterium]|jgi:gamma-glutamyltranspeptidase/glutathione hydrolase